MKSVIKLYVIILFFSISNFIQAQSKEISSVGIVPNYDEKETPFKIYGTIYMSDGITPAKNYTVTINQANENGDFLVDENDNLISAASLKTDQNGNYTFYTYVPGNDRRYNRLQEIFMKVETPNGGAYAMPTLLFDIDPMLTKRCRKQIAKRSDASRILKLTNTNDENIVKKDFILTLDLERIN
ncbi:hypothetical protein ACFQ1Q_01115 [Winogradskyella litorisediminis]|uniref:Protocatechuate 3,4-dioxygenase beta subunit n=1 Tax=Winogradskyella litorisediminis TaxID=1156618 RepID=A0ABW3N2H0_9FLAO